MLRHTEEDLDQIGYTIYKLQAYLRVIQVYLYHYDDYDYSPMEIDCLLENVIDMSKSISKWF